MRTGDNDAASADATVTMEKEQEDINCKIRVAPSRPPTKAEKNKARIEKESDMSLEKNRGTRRDLLESVG